MLGLLRAAPWRALVLVSLAGFVSACEGSAGPAGAKGSAGTGCSVVDNGDGTKTVDCAGVKVTLTDGKNGTNGKDGKDGATGAAGTNGKDGAAGAAGAAGTSCTAKKDAATGDVTISCTDGTSAVVSNGKDGAAGAAGKDGSSCTATKDSATGTTTVTCTDGTSATITDGKNGKDGVDGAAGVTGTTGAAGKDGSSCTAKDNGDGTKTISCTDGTKVTVSNGLPAPAGIAIKVTDFHGIDNLMSTGNYLNGAKKLVQATITSATADAAGVVTVNFKLMDGTKPIIGFTAVNAVGKSAFSANVVKMIPAGADVFTKWVPYIYAKDVVANTAKYQWPVGKDGDTSYKASSEKAAFGTTVGGTLTDNGDGTYKYVYLTNLATVTVDGTNLVGYDRTLTHRVAIMIGGSVGPTADAWFDFVPDGSSAPAPRDIVRTEACYQCHGETQFKGHGGNRLHVQVCVTCHNPATVEPRGGAAIDFKSLIHKIHAGADLQSVAGADGVVWDDPSTPVNEAADNGKVGNFGRYQFGIYSSSGSETTWWNVGFPAVVANCTKCHDPNNGAPQTDNWETVMSRSACGSCHDMVDFTTDTGGHKGKKQLDDKNCGICHNDGLAPSPATAHQWFNKDPRNLSEFKVDLTVSKPGNGKYFVAGESPVVSLKLTGLNDNKVLDWTVLAEDDTQTGEGCYMTDKLADCDARRDGKLASSSLFVNGPRALRMPVLTTNAHAELVSATAGPFDMSLAATNTVSLNIDGGMDITAKDAFGQDYVKLGFIAIAGKPAKFVDKTKATVDEIVTWFNSDANFKVRAIALKNSAGKLVVRSRNLGKVFSVQVANQLYTSNTGPLTTAIFGADVNVHGLTGLNPGAATNGFVPGLSTVSNVLAKRVLKGSPAVLALDDPKVKWFSDHVEYTLDPVDDLTAGTYTAKVEVTDAGVAPATAAENACIVSCNGNWLCKANCGNYRTPSVGLVNFQVGAIVDSTGKALAEEPLVARNCNSCHTTKDASGAEHGYVVDYQRHNKLLYDNATDLCGNCHDYLPQNPFLNISSPSEFGWSGPKPISRRVHAVHNGSNLTTPIATVGHSETVPGRNWDINFPQDIRNCQVCHTAATSGSWTTNPNRIACGGCHDKAAAQSHFTAMTIDPTPANPYSGDEVESCKTCH